ncbi:hypothetical protein RJ641_016240 [Dillenia turbinata]|uniref:Uncharacterized protein n=1 Tax=Dillenia turbinata TaxID=194707 RepID=A0AAN8UZ29_9MAGN
MDTYWGFLQDLLVVGFVEMAASGTAPPRGSAAAAASLRRRRTSSSGAAGGASGTMLQFYTDDAPGLKISPNIAMPKKQMRATNPESQELKENPKKIIKGQRRSKPTTLSETSPRPSNITTNNSSVLASAATFFESYTDNSSRKTIALTTIHPHHQPLEGICNPSTSWSLNSMVAILPTSPSPICSSSSRENSSLISPSSDRFFSQASSQSPTPRNEEL